ncbi:MAG: PAS domain S-box protein [Spirochaetaceae bacterium]|jgi:two-component system cell cycle sensor histidine kinase/response regulator CckA|nr:PAS domain S-box protein [Spirochaetaceae bacterium]
MDIRYEEYLKNPPLNSDDYYREIFNNISDAILILDSSSGEILDVNEQMLTMYGYTKDEVLGWNLIKFSSGISPFSQNYVLSFMERAKTEGPQIFEWEAKKVDGSLFPVEVNLRYSALGNEDILLTVVRDISMRNTRQNLSF